MLSQHIQLEAPLEQNLELDLCAVSVAPKLTHEESLSIPANPPMPVIPGGSAVPDCLPSCSVVPNATHEESVSIPANPSMPATHGCSAVPDCPPSCSVVPNATQEVPYPPAVIGCMCLSFETCSWCSGEDTAPTHGIEDLWGHLSQIKKNSFAQRPSPVKRKAVDPLQPFY